MEVTFRGRSLAGPHPVNSESSQEQVGAHHLQALSTSVYLTFCKAFLFLRMCPCKSISWDRVLVQESVCVLSPFGTLKETAAISVPSCLAASSAMACLKQEPILPDYRCFDSEPLLLYGDLEKSYLIVQVPCGGE